MYTQANIAPVRPVLKIRRVFFGVTASYRANFIFMAF